MLLPKLAYCRFLLHLVAPQEDDVLLDITLKGARREVAPDWFVATIMSMTE